jgi:hypothetical protein
MNTHTLVQKLWNYCSVLRDDGMSYGDYVEQLTYLLFRKMASMDIFCIKDDSLADSDNLPAPAVIAQEIVEDLQAALEQFKLIAGDLEAASSLEAG